jgi:hypothetical protein
MESERRDSNSFQAGSGGVLRHFASFATPDAKLSRGSMGMRRSSGGSSREGGPRSVPRPPKVFDDFVMDNQTESSDRSSERSADTAEPKPSYAMSFSPPRHSLKKSRRDSRRPFTSSKTETSAGKTEEDAYSPVATGVKFLMSRDPEEEERVLSSKSDKEKAYLYKKRYTDTYEHAVALLKHAARLESERNDKQSDLDYLRSMIETQTRIINTMGDDQVRRFEMELTYRLERN